MQARAKAEAVRKVLDAYFPAEEALRAVTERKQASRKSKKRQTRQNEQTGNSGNHPSGATGHSAK